MQTASYSGKTPNWNWRGSVSQWEQEKSDQIRVGEAICPGYLQWNPVRFPIFDSQEDKAKRAKWLAERKAPKALKKAKKAQAVEMPLNAADFGLADFM